MSDFNRFFFFWRCSIDEGVMTDDKRMEEIEIKDMWLSTWNGGRPFFWNESWNYSDSDAASGSGQSQRRSVEDRAYQAARPHSHAFPRYGVRSISKHFFPAKNPKGSSLWEKRKRWEKKMREEERERRDESKVGLSGEFHSFNKHIYSISTLCQSLIWLPEIYCYTIQSFFPHELTF